MTNQIKWRSPSNIAIVKYWGKYGTQFPMNSSISFTLKNSFTETSILWQERTKDSAHEFFYNGMKADQFGKKIISFINSIEEELNSLKRLSLQIDSVNNFPHSTGIASSASAMSALALCLVKMQEQTTSEKYDWCEFQTRASIVARLGSGSACRSVFPYCAQWGFHPQIPNSHQEYAIALESLLHNSFKEVADWIFIVNPNEKKVSSRAGHSLMEHHPYREARISQAQQNCKLVYDALQQGDWELFIRVCEEEALSLHGLMMSSQPGYLLLEEDSIAIVKSIQQFREESKVPVCFTIDAGPNIHILFPKTALDKVNEWAISQFPHYLKEDRIIKDEMGAGPVQLI